MTDFASMTARELRKIAPEHGVTGASRMTKPEIVAALTDPTRVKPRSEKFSARKPFDRWARDTMHRKAVTIYDPAAEVPEDHDRRADLRRELRRHRFDTVMLLDGGRTTRKVRLKKDKRVAGLMVPATKLTLALGRAKALAA